MRTQLSSIIGAARFRSTTCLLIPLTDKMPLANRLVISIERLTRFIQDNLKAKFIVFACNHVP